MKKVVIGIMAHVDAGKTTLSEALLYKCNAIKQMGRVDSKNAFLDTNAIEKARGITIFSKEARFLYNDLEIVLIDTPGHIDFSTEMERCLQVLDYAILVVSGSSGVQSHTITLWKLLEEYKIPTFVFINKMDQVGANKDLVIEQLNKRLKGGFVDFTNTDSDVFYENVAVYDESLFEVFLENGVIDDLLIKYAIKERKIFPCYSGAALKLQGIDGFLKGISNYYYSCEPIDEFSGIVYKISRDQQGIRLAHIKVTGGSLKVKDLIEYTSGNTFSKEIIQEKVDQIRLYSGNKYETVNQVFAGDVCMVTGLSKISIGQAIGVGEKTLEPILEPVLLYEVEICSGEDVAVVLPKLRILEEEDPSLKIKWNDSLEKIMISLMGDIQIQVLKTIIKERFGFDVSFGTGSVIYKETICNTVEGVGHFEPLRHYAEVHLLMEPLERGKGIEYRLKCSQQELSVNWQHLVLTHLIEKEHIGVLTGEPITDVRITLVSGRAHQKHTEGGDFRQATYRAVRNGIKQAQSILLEPYYNFILEIPEAHIGRAIHDIDKMKGNSSIEETRGGVATVVGSAPVSTIGGYQSQVLSYTKGEGRISFSVKGYDLCHNSEEIILNYGYDSERDVENPTGSVFCANGAGFFVSWNEVKTHMHLESILEQKNNTHEDFENSNNLHSEEMWIGEDEIEAIISKAYNSNKRKDEGERKRIYKTKNIDSNYSYPKESNLKSYYNSSNEECLLVDGYNIIYAWEDLKELININIDSARDKLIDEISNYQSIKGYKMIVVFDATKVKGGVLKEINHNNILVVYTKEGETADQYIEKYTFDNRSKYNIVVATSDALEQMTVTSVGGRVMSARELRERMCEDKKLFKEQHKYL